LIPGFRTVLKAGNGLVAGRSLKLWIEKAMNVKINAIANCFLIKIGLDVKKIIDNESYLVTEPMTLRLQVAVVSYNIFLKFSS
jgi:hypothetical protein